jgi:fumarate reductase subunit D
MNLSSRQDTLVHAVQLGALVACGGLMIHGLADFNLHIPANALLFYLLAGMASSSPVFEPTN